MTSLKVLAGLLGKRSDSSSLKSLLEQAIAAAEITLPEADIKSYPNNVYLNYYALGLSLMLVRPREHKSEAGDYRDYIIDSIDIYNPRRPAKTGESGSATERKKAFAAFPLLPIDITADDSSAGHLTAGSRGEEIVRMLGEPERKGGGSGPSSGSISVWCEWTKKGVMVEFGGDEARGPQAWERGKDAIWATLTVFPVSSN